MNFHSIHFLKTHRVFDDWERVSNVNTMSYYHWIESCYRVVCFQKWCKRQSLTDYWVWTLDIFWGMHKYNMTLMVEVMWIWIFKEVWFYLFAGAWLLIICLLEIGCWLLLVMMHIAMMANKSDPSYCNQAKNKVDKNIALGYCMIKISEHN